MGAARYAATVHERDTFIEKKTDQMKIFLEK
jgi:hypothetical protein